MKTSLIDLRKEFLEMARELIFSMGVNDQAEELCRMNFQYGLAKILLFQKEFSISPKAHFIGTPDMTVTRNNTRWNQGFGYGGKIVFGPPDSSNFLPLDIKPNACGMLTGGIVSLPSYKVLSERLLKLNKKKIKIDGIPLQWDFYESNHFIDVFEVEPLQDIELPPYVFIIHTSSSELKSENKKGIGLYFDKSKVIREKAKTFNTPFGPLYYLEGDSVKEYLDFYFYAEKFSKEKRMIAGNEIFGSFDLIANETHQGLLNAGEIILGAHFFENSSKIYPFVLRSDLPAYLVSGIPNIKNEVLKTLDFKKRAMKHNVLDSLKKANLIPHGAGYTFPHILSVRNVIEINGKRFFEILLTWSTKSIEIIQNPKDLPFEYRGQKVFLRTLELGLCKVVAKLHPVYVLKF